MTEFGSICLDEWANFTRLATYILTFHNKDEKKIRVALENILKQEILKPKC